MAYEEVFWLAIDAWKDLMELELYEHVPTLNAALEKIIGMFFRDQHRLTFPKDHTLSNEDLMLQVYNMEISEEWTSVPQLPEDRVDILRNYPRKACAEAGKARGNEGEAMRSVTTWMTL